MKSLEERFGTAQDQARRRLALKIRKAHATVDLRDLDASWPTYMQAIGWTNVAAEYEATTREALLYWLEVLFAAGQTPVSQPIPRPYDVDHIAALLRLSGPIYIKRLIKNGWPEQAALLSSLNRTIRAMQGNLNAETMQTIYDASDRANRDSMIATGQRVVQGHERVTEPGACAFCRMLAGASRKHAVFNVTEKWREPHIGCNCDLRLLPVYRTTRVRTAQEIALGNQMYEAIKASRDKARRTAVAA